MNKRFLAPLILVVATAIGIGAFFFMNTKKTAQPAPDEGFYEENVPVLSPEEIGLTLEARQDNRAVRFIIAKASDIEKIEYDLSYEADLPADATSEDGDDSDKISRGVTGEAVIKGKQRYESKYLDLGSCSRNVCKYDTGVEEVKLIMKVIKSDQKVYQAEQTLKL